MPCEFVCSLINESTLNKNNEATFNYVFVLSSQVLSLFILPSRNERTNERKNKWRKKIIPEKNPPLSFRQFTRPNSNDWNFQS